MPPSFGRYQRTLYSPYQHILCDYSHFTKLKQGHTFVIAVTGIFPSENPSRSSPNVLLHPVGILDCLDGLYGLAFGAYVKIMKCMLSTTWVSYWEGIGALRHTLPFLPGQFQHLPPKLPPWIKCPLYMCDMLNCVWSDVLHVEYSVCRRNEQDAGVRHLRLRPVLQARPDRRSEGAPVHHRPGPDHRGMARTAERGGRGWSGDITDEFISYSI